MKTTTKMYLSVVLSTACIMFYQYQLSKANLMETQQQPQQQSTEKIKMVVANNTTAAHEISANKLTRIFKNSSAIIFKDLIDVTNTPKLATTIRTMQTTDENIPPPPPLYIITPTYRRPEQVAEITRLGNTLKHIPNIYWLVIEDANVRTALLTRQLERLKIPYEHLIAPMPTKFKKDKVKPRGVSNRNRGLQWIRTNAHSGVFYFADDDNTYDLEIFNQMRYTKKVSMWPVGLVTKFGISSPIIRSGKIDGFYDGWIGGRKFPVDMAGFAVNVQFFLSRPKAQMPFKPGYEEDGFLRSLEPLNITEIELLASDCTEVLTWHTQTKKNEPATKLDMKKYDGTNLVTLRKLIV